MFCDEKNLNTFTFQLSLNGPVHDNWETWKECFRCCRTRFIACQTFSSSNNINNNNNFDKKKVLQKTHHTIALSFTVKLPCKIWKRRLSHLTCSWLVRLRKCAKETLFLKVQISGLVLQPPGKMQTLKVRVHRSMCPHRILMYAQDVCWETFQQLPCQPGDVAGTIWGRWDQALHDGMHWWWR